MHSTPPHRPMRPLAAFLTAILACSLGCIYHDTPSQVRGNGVYFSEDRTPTVPPFGAISLDSSANLEVVVDPTISAPAIVVSADKNLLPLILTEVRDDRLHVGAKRGYTSRNGVLVQIVTPSLSAVTLRGSGNIDVQNLNAQRFAARISGSGQITVAGHARDVDFSVTGSGTIVAADLDAQTAEAGISGSGNISLLAREAASMSISGSGAIACYGDPLRVNRSVTGSGEILLR